jgi:hypothetical protein
MNSVGHAFPSWWSKEPGKNQTLGTWTGAKSVAVRLNRYRKGKTRRRTRPTGQPTFGPPIPACHVTGRAGRTSAPARSHAKLSAEPAPWWHVAGGGRLPARLRVCAAAAALANGVSPRGLVECSCACTCAYVEGSAGQWCDATWCSLDRMHGTIACWRNHCVTFCLFHILCIQTPM